jgi:hypothetical protein
LAGDIIAFGSGACPDPEDERTGSRLFCLSHPTAAFLGVLL